MKHILWISACASLGFGPSIPAVSAPAENKPAAAQAAPAWNERNAEHLLNRAGFGGTRADVARLVAVGQAAAVESMFAPKPDIPSADILAKRSLHGELESPNERLAGVVGRREDFLSGQPDLIVPLNKYANWWIERMLRADDPVRDRMAIFWHGHFCSSIKEVMNSQEMIEQIEFLRDNALGPFETLVRGIGRTPAMLEYLDNAENVKEHPNENWARELMELFSLGDGNYTEKDIKEASRAFTGWSDEESRFVFKRLDHDFGQKTVLGVTGKLDGDHVIDIVMQQPACASFLATKLLVHFEGQKPSAARAEDYAQFLRDNAFDIGKFLRRLFLDPQFYRDEVVGTRVAPPIEYLVGAARRLEIDVPGQMVLNAGEVLGQRLFWPPSVKGWEGGMAWITTATMMNRSNMTGVMLETINVQTLILDEDPSGLTEMAALDPREDKEDKPDASGPLSEKRLRKRSRTNGLNQLADMQNFGWHPALSLTDLARSSGAKSDAEIVAWMLDELLAIPVQMDSNGGPLSFLKAERERAGLSEGALLSDAAKAEPILRDLAHLIFSTPEAQLN